MWYTKSTIEYGNCFCTIFRTEPFKTPEGGLNKRTHIERDSKDHARACVDDELNGTKRFNQPELHYTAYTFGCSTMVHCSQLNKYSKILDSDEIKTSKRNYGIIRGKHFKNNY